VGEVSKCVSASLNSSYRESYKRRARALLDWMEDPAEKVAAYLRALPPAGK
jgi:hypothetical protein